LALGTRSYSSVATILKNAQDKKAADPEQPSLFHENNRASRSGNSASQVSGQHR
jgi:hypothetical protein